MDGDWVCTNPGCKNKNFARRKECNRCSTPRPGGTSQKSSGTEFRGPPGLFKSGDWGCLICGNINWERRSDCNICKAPKPGMPGMDEKRDGAGGGFNERQERVASAKTEVDEDGYDDFGVKKKKVSATKAEREAAALARLKESYSAVILPDNASLHTIDTTGIVNRHDPSTLQQTARPSRSSPPKIAKMEQTTRRRSRSRERDQNRHHRGRKDRRQNSPHCNSRSSSSGRKREHAKYRSRSRSNSGRRR